MKVAILTSWFSLQLALTGVVAIPTKGEQDRASVEIANLQKTGNQYIESKISGHGHSCNSKTIVRRQEWGTLSKKARLDYVAAVKCLQAKPPLLSKTDVPGVRSRFDDFAATHIQRTPYVHFDGLFLPFHRQLVWLYEKALREECGYKGTQPYWDWTISWEDQRKSTVFDGSPYSMGSNGKAIPHGPTNISAFGLSLTIQPGTGGGCLYSGPFTGYNVTLGPVAFEPKGPDGGLGYNPRCLSRDISFEWSNHTKPTDVLSLLTTCKDVGCFDTQFEDINGVHAGGHFSLGGLGIDAYSSAGDPAFWLHHAQIDRMWTIWQNINPNNRSTQVSGTGTAFNNPPSADVTLDTKIDFGILGPQKAVGKAVSTIENDFCYMYV
ncbi:Di-copper centre-containing protein [Xylariaceae sp. AK1471]|nr:Di-copper centre-containing protein [Xylariaceae sp. AK1471]